MADDQGLQAAIDTASAAAQAALSLSGQMDQVARDRRRDKKVYVSLLATIILILVCLGGAGLWYRSDQHRRSDEATVQRNEQATATAQVKRLAMHINDCLSATGKCYRERTDTRYGEPTGPINTVFVYALACSQTHVGDQAILTCVEHKLREK